MWDEESFLKTVDKVLADDRLSTFQKFRLWEDLSELTAALVETEVLFPQLSLIERIKSILTTSPAYYICRRRIMETVWMARSFLSNLENVENVRKTGLVVRETLEQLLWYWQLEPEQEIGRASYSLEVRLLVRQTRRRLMRYRDAVIGFSVGSITLLAADKLLVDHLYLRVQSGVSPIEVILFHIGIFAFGLSSLFLALGLYYFAMYVLHVFHMLAQFQPPTRGAGTG